MKADLGSTPFEKIDAGVYVRKSGSTLYYSLDNSTNWKDAISDVSAPPPANAEDLTATDARGYSRSGRPDIGAYEVGGTNP